MNICATPKKPALLYAGPPYRRLVSRLSKLNAPEENPNKIRASKIIIVSLVSAMLILFVLVFFASAFYAIDRFSQPEPQFVEIIETTSTTPATSTSTSTTTTLSMAPASTMMPATSTTLYTTTTIACGGDDQAPCLVNGSRLCGKGRVLGSDFLCKPVGCAPTTPSGRSGCGEWALEWCRS